MKIWAFLTVSILLQGSLFSQTPSKTEVVKKLLTDAEQIELSKALAKYYKARQDDNKEAETLEKLKDQITSIEKKKKIDSLLKHPEEWVPVLDMADDFSKGIKGGQESVQEFSFEEGTKYRFGIFTPKKYDSKAAWPLLLVIPDAADENLKEHFAKNWGHESIRDNFVICVPQMPQNTKLWTEQEGYGAALGSYGRVIRQVHVDCNKVFIAGIGNGAKTAAAIASLFPSRFAGLIVRGTDPGLSYPENLQSLPSLFTKKSDLVEAFTKALDSFGYKNYTVHEEESLEKVAAWAQEQTRNNYPLNLTFRPPKSMARNAYWVRVERWETTEGLAPEQQPIFKAIIDKEKNQVTVNANGVYSFFLSFNDEMLDLDKTVTVVINNKPHVATYTRNLKNFVDGVFRRNDNRIVFTSGPHYFDAPPVANSSK